MRERAPWEDKATWPRMITLVGGMFVAFIVLPLSLDYELNPGAVAGTIGGAVLAVIAMAIKASREKERRIHAALQGEMAGETTPAPEEGISEAFSHPAGTSRDE